MGGAFAHLRHAAGGAGELVGIHRLDGVDHAHRRLRGFDGGEDFFQLNFRQHVHLAAFQPQAARAQRHLRAAFLAGDVQRGQTQALQRIERLQQQRGFANARIAPNQHHAAFHHATAEHTVEFSQAGGRARYLRGLDGGQRLHGLRLGQASVLAAAGAQAVFAGAGHFGHGFHQGVPSATAGALAQPARAGGAAFVAGEKGFVFGHGPSYPRRSPA